MTHAPPERLGRYRVVSELGRGAMGIVYKGEDEALGRAVAIKTVLMSFATEEHAGYLARFRQEARALGALNHPSIISVYDYGDEGDIAYMAMELLEGRELRKLMAESRIAVPAALDIAAQVAEGLAFAHARGVVHRDVKPGNVMVVEGNRAKIMDFGIARVRASDVKTQTGTMLGSPKYMSPEQILGRAVDHRSDIFSLGVVLYEMLAGVPPFAGDDIPQVMYQVCNARATPPSQFNPAVPVMLDLIVGKALEKALEARYQDAGELAADLRKFLADPSVNALAALASSQGGGESAAATQTLQATMASMAFAGTPTLGLLPWRSFDSTRALGRLGRARGEDRALMAPTGAEARTWERVRADRDLLMAIAAVGAAIAIAVTVMLA